MRLTIIEDRETLDIDEMGNLVPFRRIQYKLDNKGPYIYEVPIRDWDVADFREHVKQRAKELKELEGLEL